MLGFPSFMTDFRIAVMGYGSRDDGFRMPTRWYNESHAALLLSSA